MTSVTTIQASRERIRLQDDFSYTPYHHYTCQPGETQVARRLQLYQTDPPITIQEAWSLQPGYCPCYCLKSASIWAKYVSCSSPYASLRGIRERMLKRRPLEGSSLEPDETTVSNLKKTSFVLTYVKCASEVGSIYAAASQETA